MKFYVWQEGKESIKFEIHRDNPREAAICWADVARHDVDLTQGFATVNVCAPDGEVTRWSVYGEHIVRYSAKMITGEEP